MNISHWTSGVTTDFRVGGGGRGHDLKTYLPQNVVHPNMPPADVLRDDDPSSSPISLGGVAAASSGEEHFNVTYAQGHTST